MLPTHGSYQYQYFNISYFDIHNIKKYPRQFIREQQIFSKILRNLEFCAVEMSLGAKINAQVTKIILAHI